MNTKIKIPFYKMTNELAKNQYSKEIEWKDNYEFEDTMEIVGMNRKGHSITYIMVSKTDHKKYSIFIKEMLNILQNGSVNKGIVSGSWTFCKRGQEYSLRFLN